MAGKSLYDNLKGMFHKEPEIPKVQNFQLDAVESQLLNVKMTELDEVYKPSELKSYNDEIEAMNAALQSPHGSFSYMNPEDRDMYVKEAMQDERVLRQIAEALANNENEFIVNVEFPDELVGSGFSSNPNAPGGAYKPIYGKDTNVLSIEIERDLSQAGFRITDVRPNLDVNTAVPNGVDVKTIADKCDAKTTHYLPDGTVQKLSPGVAALRDARVSGMTMGVSYDRDTDSVYMVQMGPSPNGGVCKLYQATTASPIADPVYDVRKVTVLENGQLQDDGKIRNQGTMRDMSERTSDPYGEIRSRGYGAFARNAEILNESVNAVYAEYTQSRVQGFDKVGDYYRPTKAEIVKDVSSVSKSNKVIHDVMQTASRIPDGPDGYQNDGINAQRF